MKTYYEDALWSHRMSTDTISIMIFSKDLVLFDKLYYSNEDLLHTVRIQHLMEHLELHGHQHQKQKCTL